MGPRWNGEARRLVAITQLAHVILQALQTPDPQWANPIKSQVRKINQARAINEVVNALKPLSNGGTGSQRSPLRVMNGPSTTSSVPTNFASENIYTNLTEDFPGRPGRSTCFLGGAIQSSVEFRGYDGEPLVTQVPKYRTRQIMPSLATLEKAVSARIYFENLYFPLLRQPPSRKQRRVAMEKDMSAMDLEEEEKAVLRARWNQNETDYFRERRRKVDATAFVKLKTIGHGIYLSKSGWGWIVNIPPRRCIWSCISCERTCHGTVIRDETGVYI